MRFILLSESWKVFLNVCLVGCVCLSESVCVDLLKRNLVVVFSVSCMKSGCRLMVDLVVVCGCSSVIRLLKCWLIMFRLVMWFLVKLGCKRVWLCVYLLLFVIKMLCFSSGFMILICFDRLQLWKCDVSIVLMFFGLIVLMYCMFCIWRVKVGFKLVQYFFQRLRYVFWWKCWKFLSMKFRVKKGFF